MFRIFHRCLLALVIALYASSALAVAPIHLKGMLLHEGDGAQILLEAAKAAEPGILWSHIEMEPPTFKIYGSVVKPENLVLGSKVVTIRTKHGNRNMAQVVRLKWFAYLVVASRDIKRGEVLNAGDLKVELVEYKRSYGSVFSQIDRVLGFVARRNIKIGSPITDRDIEGAYLIERGSSVIVMVRSGAVDVKVGGVALESGVRGDKIKVRIPKFRKDVEAVVIDAKTVMVELD